MPITTDFKYYKPEKLREAMKMLSVAGNSARVLAGGTDLTVRLKEGLETPEIVIDIKGIPELKQINVKGKKIHIGALVTFTELINSEIIRTKLPLIWEASKTVASVGTRNRATIVGNICSAVPSLDSAPALLNYEAIVCLNSLKGKRQIPISQWFTTPRKTERHPDEIVTEIIVPVPQKKHAVYYGKLGRYKGEDLAQAGLSLIAFPGKQFRVAFCAVGPIPERSLKIETLLNGQDINDELIGKCKTLIEEEITPITDIRATKEYRMHIMKVMFERGLKEVVGKLNSKKKK